MANRAIFVFLIVSALGLSACSFARSSSSPFRWSSESIESSFSPLGWSSDSSSNGDERSAPAREESSYERDVRETTSSIIESGGGSRELRRAIGNVAGAHGISDWEAESATFRGIGRGLAGLGVDDFELLSAEISAGSEVRERLLLQGYTAGK